jgi:branched-subunit amino acid transport protein AzlD
MIFRDKETPEYINFLGKYLPYSIMGMLVVYCLKDVSITSSPFGIPELISVVLVAVLHFWKRNTLVSIVSGTVCYMLLIQVF